MRETDHTIEVEGASLHVRERGRGAPLLLLHGLTGTGADWQHVFDVEALAARHRLIAPDARGHGRSTGAAASFGFRRCAGDVLAILDALGIERAAAIGMSLGAKTLLHAATSAPQRIESMVLVSATPRLPAATCALFRAAAAAPHGEAEWAAMRAQHVHGDAQIEVLWALPARLADDAAQMSLGPEQLATITARTLIVAGDRDPLYPVELAMELFRGVPGAQLYVVPGGGHGPIFEAERAPFAARALAFLGSELRPE
jgi:pimeloyl-ACP methyl ester carboxylesterase